MRTLYAIEYYLELVFDTLSTGIILIFVAGYLFL